MENSIADAKAKNKSCNYCKKEIPNYLNFCSSCGIPIIKLNESFYKNTTDKPINYRPWRDINCDSKKKLFKINQFKSMETNYETTKNENH